MSGFTFPRSSCPLAGLCQRNPRSLSRNSSHRRRCPTLRPFISPRPSPLQQRNTLSRPIQASSPTSDGNGWFPPIRDPGPILDTISHTIQTMAKTLTVWIQFVYETQRTWIQRAWARAVMACAIAVGLATATVNAWGVPAVNRKLPQLSQHAAHILQREVSLGRVHWLAPTGVFGIHPVASIGPVDVGPGPAEKSTTTIDRVSVSVDPFRSIVRGRIVLAFKASNAQVHLHQADNFSWFGYPDDTEPSSRSFVPGLESNNHTSSDNKKKPPRGGVAGGGGGLSSSSSSSEATTSSHMPSTIHSDIQSYMPSTIHSDVHTVAPVVDAEKHPANLLNDALSKIIEWHQTQENAMQQSLLDHATARNGTTHEVCCDGDKVSMESSQRQVSDVTDHRPSLIMMKADADVKRGGMGRWNFLPFGKKENDMSSQAIGRASNDAEQQGSTAPAAAPQDLIAGFDGDNRNARKIDDINGQLKSLQIQNGHLYSLTRTPSTGGEKKQHANQHDLQGRQEEASNVPAIVQNEIGTAAATNTTAARTDATDDKDMTVLDSNSDNIVETTMTTKETSINHGKEISSYGQSANKIVETPQPAAALSREPDARATNRMVLYTSEEEEGFKISGRSEELCINSNVLTANELDSIRKRDVMSSTVDSTRGAAMINQLPSLTMSLHRSDGRSPKQQSDAMNKAKEAVLDTLHADKEESKSTVGNSFLVSKEPKSTALNFINSLPTVSNTAPLVNVLKEDIQSAVQTSTFRDIVVDPVTERKKGLGSKALQRARKWQPATSTNASATMSMVQREARGRIGSLGVAATLDEAPRESNGALSDSAADVESNAATSVPSVPSSVAGGGASVVNASPNAASVSPMNHHHNSNHSIRNGKRHITHPGYFMQSPGPVYTPAPPEALAKIRAKQKTLFSELRRLLNTIAVHAQRSIDVGSIDIAHSTLYGHIYGENLPRIFEQVNGTVNLGPGYDSLTIELHALPHERDPSSKKCTMPSPFAHKHLREYTGKEATKMHHKDGPPAGTAPDNTVHIQNDNTAKRDRDSTSLTTAAAPQNTRRPTGGKVTVLVDASGIANNDLATGGSRIPNLTVTILGQDLHAPLIERIIELPMDIDGGRVDGNFVLRCHDVSTWEFPEFEGRVAVHKARFHFWDATDDIIDADMDLLFEKDRVYLHNARGRFGAVPMKVTGDLDLDPLTGCYRLSAVVPGVEANQLRATLGVRPTPFPVAGCVAGTLHVSGPLEKPIFSGQAQIIRPTEEMLDDCEDTAALQAVLDEPTAVGAYDHVPVADAGLVFSLNTLTNVMTLHAVHADPVGGGHIDGSGKMLVSPTAEMDPSALDVSLRCHDLPTESLVDRYLPAESRLPSNLLVGKAAATVGIHGAHLSPVINVDFSVPDGGASGLVKFAREQVSLAMTSSYLDAKGSVFLRPPTFEAAKSAVTQKQATELAKPDVTGCDVDMIMKGLDAVPLVSAEDALRQVAQQSGEPLRLKVNGRVKVAGAVKKASHRDDIRDQWLFQGGIDLEDVRLNQLKLYRALKGHLSLSDTKVSLHAKGLRADEALDVDLTLPLLPEVNASNKKAVAGPVEGTASAGNEDARLMQEIADGRASEESIADADAMSISSVVNSVDGVSVAVASAPPNGSAVLVAAPSSTSTTNSTTITTGTTPLDNDRASGSAFNVRCGQLSAAGTLDARGRQLDFRMANVRLDELELASLRGDLHEISCSLNFESQTGRGRLNVGAPRYSGVSGESLSGGFRWERDVVRLEKCALQQKHSRYEVQGEYVVPPSQPLPTSAADLARSHQQQQHQGGETALGAVSTATLPSLSVWNARALPQSTAGRWRVRIDVPTADMQEILPAARLLQSAATRGPSDYERAKSAFMQSIHKLTLQAGDLNTQLQALAEKAIVASSTNNGTRELENSKDNTKTRLHSPPPLSPLPSSALQLPGFQDITGTWNGSIQAFGGGGGATSCEFDVRGSGWKWGDAALDLVVLDGNYHSEEGVQLQELVLKSGDAKLLVRGSLLNDHQDASILLTDFPVATLRPIFRAIPALQNAAPAVSAKDPDPVQSPMPLGMLVNAVNRASQDLQKGATAVGDDADSPINGLLYVSGTLGGSKDTPTGEVAVRVYDAAIGATRLAQAQASARLSESMVLSFNVDIVPVEGHRKSGHIRAAGNIPLVSVNKQGESKQDGMVNASSSFSTSENAAQLGQEIESSAVYTTIREEGASVSLSSMGNSNSSSVSTLTPTQQQQQQPLDVRLSIRDSGMSVLTSITPDFQWQSGEADLSFRLTGTLDQPAVTGGAIISKGIIDCPILRFPVSIVSARVNCADGMLEVDTVDARVGKKGHIRLRGVLPVYQPRSKQQGAPPPRGAAPVLAAMQHRMTIDVGNLELKVRNLYAGQLDALLTVRDSVERPLVGGSLRFSRGSIYLIPQGQEMGASPGTSAAIMGGGSGTPSSPSVAKVFRLLTRGETGLAAKLEDAVRQEVEAVEAMVEETAGPNVTLDALALQFGPDLRAVYPLVMNFAVSGEVALSGPAHPDAIVVEGALRLPSGEVNLVAAQLELDREHANTLIFGGSSSGVDPLVDLVLVSGDLRVSVRGRASEWADHLVMQSVGGGTTGGDAVEQLDAAEAARLLESKLKAALLADDGQLALSRLAGSTMSTLLPKIETQGTVGGARWRLVSAPAIPGLLDPLLADPSNFLGSITMGTEVEVQFGRKLQAAMVRKLRDSDVITQWTLNYSLNSKLRMQFNISSAPPYPKTLMFQYSSEGSG